MCVCCQRADRSKTNSYVYTKSHHFILKKGCAKHTCVTELSYICATDESNYLFDWRKLCSRSTPSRPVCQSPPAFPRQPPAQTVPPREVELLFLRVALDRCEVVFFFFFLSSLIWRDEREGARRGRQINCEHPRWSSLMQQVKAWNSKECACCWECCCWSTAHFSSLSQGGSRWKKVQHPAPGSSQSRERSYSKTRIDCFSLKPA